MKRLGIVTVTVLPFPISTRSDLLSNPLECASDTGPPIISPSSFPVDGLKSGLSGVRITPIVKTYSFLYLSLPGKECEEGLATRR